MPEAFILLHLPCAQRRSDAKRIGDLAANDIHREAHIVEAAVAFERVVGGAISAVPELGYRGKTSRADINRYSNELS